VPRVESELAANVFDVQCRGCRRNPKLIGDAAIGQPQRHQTGDFTLAWRELGDLRPRTWRGRTSFWVDLGCQANGLFETQRGAARPGGAKRGALEPRVGHTQDAIIVAPIVRRDREVVGLTPRRGSGKELLGPVGGRVTSPPPGQNRACAINAPGSPEHIRCMSMRSRI
jgi:hypothetical protein